MKITIYDKPGSSDRYTVVVEIGQLTDFYALSANAGFNQYLGAGSDNFGKGLHLKKGKHLGNVVEYGALPDEVKSAILKHLAGY